MRIIFVGVHNKPNKKPLCSSTRSGKRVDLIASHFPEFEIVKSNVFNLNYMPKGNEWHNQITKFFKRIELDKDDMVIMLGFEVQRAIKGDERVICPYILTHHPSLQFQKMTEAEYVAETVKKIKEQLYFVYAKEQSVA